MQLVLNSSVMEGAPSCVLAQESPAQTASDPRKALNFTQGDNHDFEKIFYLSWG
jgi:hypothetical protein